MSVKNYIKSHKKQIGILGAVTGAVVGTIAVHILNKKTRSNKVTDAQKSKKISREVTKKVPAKKQNSKTTKKVAKTTKRKAPTTNKVAAKKTSAKKK